MELIQDIIETTEISQQTSRNRRMGRMTMGLSTVIVTALSMGTAFAAIVLPDETSFDRTITVNPAAAEVTGSSYQTVTSALNYAKNTSLPAGQKTKIFIKNGTYREAGGVSISGYDNPSIRSTLLTIEGESKSGVIIKGSSVYSGWTEVAGHPGVWQNTWNNNYKLEAYDFFGQYNGPGWQDNDTAALGIRKEIAFVGGRRLEQKTLENWRLGNINTSDYRYIYKGFLGLNNLTDYSFGVAELGANGPGDTIETIKDGKGNVVTLASIYNDNPHGYANKIFVKLPSGVNPNTTPTEVGDLTTDTFLKFSYKDNVVLRNLKLTQFANGATNMDKAVVAFWEDKYSGNQVAYDKVRLQNVEISGNSNRGLHLQSMKNVSVENSRINDNGQLGVAGGRIQDVQVVDSTFNDNNWRSDAPGTTYGWNSAGFKTGGKNLSFLRCDFRGNYNNGLWFDGGVTTTTVEDCWSIGNGGNGFWAEIAPGPLLYKNNRSEANGSVGLRIGTSRNITVDGGSYINNELVQIDIEGFGKNRDVGYGFDVFKVVAPDRGVLPPQPGDGANVEYRITSGNIKIKNAYIATGMGTRSYLIGYIPAASQGTPVNDRFSSAADLLTAWKNNYTGENNTFYFANGDASKAFRLGANFYSLNTWSSTLPETGAKASAKRYNEQAVSILSTTDGRGTTKTGKWNTITPSEANADKVYSTSFIETEPNTVDVRTVRFAPTLTNAGKYRVDYSIFKEWFIGIDVPVTVSGTATTTNRRETQSAGGAANTFGWYPLGIHQFNSGSTGYVEFANGPGVVVPQHGNGHVRAGTVRFTPIPNPSRTATSKPKSTSKPD